MWLENEKSNATIKEKAQDIEVWMHINRLPVRIMQQVRPHVRRMIEEKTDFNARNPLPHLPNEISRAIKRYMYSPLLRRVSYPLPPSFFILPFEMIC
jgi:hypothetical protein